ncbi:MAG: peptide chain release factor N(5)-glutamine methyltransferase [Chloroflexi bacterium]|nr:peptide chain release factor N(5)-glutamine methyltransferase [Chloroflexota bacterium]
MKADATIFTPLYTILAQRLSAVSETPLLDAQVLLAYILDKPRTWVLAHLEASLTPIQSEALQAALSSLEQGEPLPYVLGHWEFYGVDLLITPEVLIPRPETELLVEEALRWLRDHPSRRRTVDVGTGSGCIAVSLAAHTPDLHLLATDLSPGALRVAQANLRHSGLSGRVQLIQVDLLAALVGPFDLVCANLPYVPTDMLHSLAVYRREPALALDGGTDGLDLIRRLLLQAKTRLATGGRILCEIEAGQGMAAQELGYVVFPEAQVRVIQDLSGRDRLLIIDHGD